MTFADTRDRYHHDYIYIYIYYSRVHLRLGYARAIFLRLSSTSNKDSLRLLNSPFLKVISWSTELKSCFTTMTMTAIVTPSYHMKQ